MTLVLAQTIGSSSDPKLLMVMGIICLLVLVALGGKFFVNLFEVITAPAASLGHHGKNDNFFFSMFVVFWGGMIGSVFLLLNKVMILEEFQSFATSVGNYVAQGNGSEIYRPDAAAWGTTVLTSGFDLYIVSNFIFFPVIAVVCWLLAGSLMYMFAKLLGGLGELSEFLGSVAYGAMFMAIGCAMSFVLKVQMLSMFSSLVGSGGVSQPSPDAISIIGLVLTLYGLILFIIGIGQGASITGGQVVGVVLIYLILVGVICYLIQSQLITPALEDFTTQIIIHNPS